MERYIEKAAVLIEALPYIQSFRGKVVVIKFGGSVMDSDECIDSILKDVVFMHTVGIKPVVVHGGGGLISARMKAAGLKPQFVDGYRVTDAETIKVVEDTLVNTINGDLCRRVREFGATPEGHSGRDLGIIRVRKFTPPAQEGGRKGAVIDLGYVGEVDRIDVGPVLSMLDNDRLPLLASLGLGSNGMAYNVNADEMAAELAAEIRAEKLVFLTDVKGVMRNPSDESSLISTLDLRTVEQLLRDKVIEGGMIPKIRGCIRAVRSGVHKTHIIDGRVPHSLLLEVFTDEGIGTQIVP